MTIYRQYGTRIESIEAVEFKANEIWVTAKMENELGLCRTEIWSLRADNGLNEIIQAICDKFPKYKSQFGM